jgi:Putative Ig domain
MLAFTARGNHRVSGALRRRVPSEILPGPGDLLGLELEFSVRSPGGSRVNFGSLIHRLALDGIALDPADPNAYRCSWGGVITCDGAEAEIATPPVWTRPGFTGELRAWAETGEAALRRAAPRGIQLDGYSAHFSAAMPARLNEHVCHLYAETFAADLMLMMDRVGTPGLLVRPRPGRTELCGEFIEGTPLPAAAAFVAGTARACAAAARRRSAQALLPPKLEVRLASAVHRYGWYVDHRAFGTDLHAASRRALLPRASGGTISAQSHLELAWAAARGALAAHASASDLQAAEAMVTGTLPLPTELGQLGDRAHGQPGVDSGLLSGASTFPKTKVPRLCAHARPGFTLRPVTATWDFTVFEATGRARRAYLCVPRNSLPGFIDNLDVGALDDAIAAYLARPSGHRVLSAHQQTRRLGLYDQLGAPAGLLAPERDPQTGNYEPAERGGKHTLARPGKRSQQDTASESPRRQEGEGSNPPRRFARRVIAIGAGAAVLLAIAGVAVAQHLHGPSADSAGLVTFQPSVLSFSNVAINRSATRLLTVTNNGRSPIAVTRIQVSGPDWHDFAVPFQPNPGLAHRIGQAIQVAEQRPPRCLRPLRAERSCHIQVIFTPSAPGPRTADLRIYFASRQQPQHIALSGTGKPPAVALALAPTSLPAAAAGAPVRQRITATGGAAPYRFSVTSGNLPPGLSLNPRTGVISGTPTTAGSYPFTITATDSSPVRGSGSRAYTLQIAPPAVTLTLAPTSLPDATADSVECDGDPYAQTLTATGGKAPYGFAVSSGSLPPGLALSTDGVINGTVATSGSYQFTVTATDSSPIPNSGAQTYTLRALGCVG